MNINKKTVNAPGANLHSRPGIFLEARSAHHDGSGMFQIPYPLRRPHQIG
jgi:hypothetical protein